MEILMFLTSSPEDDIVKLRSSLSDIKFIVEDALRNNKKMTEKTKALLDDIIKITDVGMYVVEKDGMERAKQAFNEKYEGCCGEDK